MDCSASFLSTEAAVSPLFTLMYTGGGSLWTDMISWQTVTMSWKDAPAISHHGGSSGMAMLSLRAAKKTHAHAIVNERKRTHRGICNESFARLQASCKHAHLSQRHMRGTDGCLSAPATASIQVAAELWRAYLKQAFWNLVPLHLLVKEYESWEVGRDLVGMVHMAYEAEGIEDPHFIR
jgi:hypothetical protein